MFGPGGISIWQILIILFIPVVVVIWVIARSNRRQKSEAFNPHSPSEELAKLHQLKEDGAISQEEFDQQKKRLLGTKAND